MEISLKQISLFILFLFILASCESKQDSNKSLNLQQEQIMNEANRQVGMPAIVNFQERKLAKTIFELRDKEDLVCYAYIKSDYNGKLIFLGKCIGYGLPYSVQYTNPEVDIFTTTSSTAHHNLPQADPNGLFMPTGLSATWLMMIDPKTNQARPVYIEPEIIVSPFELQP